MELFSSEWFPLINVDMATRTILLSTTQEYIRDKSVQPRILTVQCMVEAPVKLITNYKVSILLLLVGIMWNQRMQSEIPIRLRILVALVRCQHVHFPNKYSLIINMQSADSYYVQRSLLKRILCG